MLYALLFYGREDEWDQLDRAARGRVMASHIEELNQANQDGTLVTSMRLLRTDAATTVRVPGGRVRVLDGPFAETKEQLGGLQVLDCDDLDAAIRYATTFAAHWGTVEIRPLHPDPGSLD